jgi:hypothetical protein
MDARLLLSFSEPSLEGLAAFLLISHALVAYYIKLTSISEKSRSRISEKNFILVTSAASGFTDTVPKSQKQRCGSGLGFTGVPGSVSGSGFT